MALVFISLGEPVVLDDEVIGALPGPLELPVPNITRRQLRLWLVRNGIALATIETAIGALAEPERTEAQIEWADAQSYEFSNPLVVQIGTAIGMTVEQMKAGWREAALI